MKRYYLIDHRILFLFGYTFYLFVPLIAGRAEIFEGLPGIVLYQKYFDAIPGEKINSYIWITITWLPAFFFGHYTFSILRPKKSELQKFLATPVSLATAYMAPLLIIVLLLFAYLGRGSLFAGYDTYDVSVRGKLSTLLVVFNFFLIYQLLSRQQISALLIAGTIGTALLLLSMGGRMYVFQTFIVLLVYKTSFADKRWKLLQIISLTAISFMVATTAGIWRMRDSLSFKKGLYSIVAEPVFTWFSTGSFLSLNEDIPLLQFPKNFLTSFFNMVPNSIINLQQFVISTKQMGYNYENPLGAESVWSTLIINFGIIGTVLFLFVTGFTLNFLRSISSRSRMAAVYYIMICGIIPFQLFRDGFYILNKQIVFNFFLLPACILGILQIIEYTEIILHRTDQATTAKTE